QATLRIVKVFWGLSSALAYRRHFPAIDWLTSYSLYVDRIGPWFNENINKNWLENRLWMMNVLQQESELQEIVQLVGMDALSLGDRLSMEVARSIREDYLHQNAFDDVDTYTSPAKQFQMLGLIRQFDQHARTALANGANIDALLSLPVREEIGRAKYIPEAEVAESFAAIRTNIVEQTSALGVEGGVNLA
ncbi:MAG: V-type ATP synthase subunit A, partial [Clostridiales bacterium]|nr:V-type ATP synthase subunit A [Clostridiales bacterium]